MNYSTHHIKKRVKMNHQTAETTIKHIESFKNYTHTDEIDKLNVLDTLRVAWHFANKEERNKIECYANQIKAKRV